MILSHRPLGCQRWSNETLYSIHTVKAEVKDSNAEVVVKFAPKGSVAPEGLSAADSPSTMDQPLSDTPLS